MSSGVQSVISDSNVITSHPTMAEPFGNALIEVAKKNDKIVGLSADLAKYTDEELARMTVSRKYQIAQQCLYAASAKPEEAADLVKRLGAEFEAWFRYVLERKGRH
jgi:hypothetical protein